VTAGREASTTFAVACRSTTSGTLLFTSDRSGESHVYRAKPDGSGIGDLTPGGSAATPDWSPDLTRIAFGSLSDGGVYLMLADGSHRNRIGTGGAPVWSPDGSRIAFSGPDGVTVMNADGSDPVVLAPGYSPSWSPDGTMIAFNRQGQCVADICGVDLYVMKSNGSGARNLTFSSEFSFDQWLSPSWSPDGTLIAFTRHCCFLQAHASGIGTVEPTGGTPSLVYRGEAAGKPVWSPDGSTLAFAVRQDDGTTELMLMLSGGGAPATLASSPGSEYPGSWR
jgi:Tol biopolymer transport system component